MILVNISAVGTSITFTLQPVSCSHLGPEKFFGSSDCRPASQTMVTVLPAQIFLAASTAFCAAPCADAVPLQLRVAAASIARNGALIEPGPRRTGNEFPMMSPPLRVLVIDFAPRAEPPENGRSEKPDDYVEQPVRVSSEPGLAHPPRGSRAYAGSAAGVGRSSTRNR